MKAYRFFILLVILLLSACSPSAVVSPTLEPTQAATATALPTSTELPSPTATEASTNTPEPTATAVPPTETPVPALAVLDNGFNVWCAPIEYAGTRPAGYEEPEYARKMTYAESLPVASIPAVYCVVSFKFNQAAPSGLALQVKEGSHVFITKTLDPAAGQADTVWTFLDHPYIINPPMWEVNYTLAVVDAGAQELWSSPIKFAKPLPETCIYGGLPDPVTLFCAVTDPWEIEPHPDATYPYDRSRLTPEP